MSIYFQRALKFVGLVRKKLFADKQDSFPLCNILCLVRDFINPNTFAFGREGGKKYLENVLEREDLPETLKEIRKGIECIKEIKCFLMPHPGCTATEPEECSNNHDPEECSSFSGGITRIDSRCVKQLKELTDFLLDPKSLLAMKEQGNLPKGGVLLPNIISAMAMLHDEKLSESTETEALAFQMNGPFYLNALQGFWKDMQKGNISSENNVQEQDEIYDKCQRNAVISLREATAGLSRDRDLYEKCLQTELSEFKSQTKLAKKAAEECYKEEMDRMLTSGSLDDGEFERKEQLHRQKCLTSLDKELQAIVCLTLSRLAKQYKEINRERLDTELEDGESPMTIEHINKIDGASEHLQKLLDLSDDLLATLKSRKIISADRAKELLNRYHDEGYKKLMLLEHLKKRPDSAFDRFIKALIDSDQAHIIKYLR